MPAKPFRMALGLLIIQKQYGYSDRELLEQITENPYYQYFVGLPGFQNEPPFVLSLLVEFRKRLNEARENLEALIDSSCNTFGYPSRGLDGQRRMPLYGQRCHRNFYV